MDTQGMAVMAAFTLIFINGMFLFTSTMPASMHNDDTLNFGLDTNQLSDINSYLGGYIDDANNLTGPDVNTADSASAATQDKAFMTLFLDYLAGALETAGYAFSLIGMLFNIIGGIFFGYLVWIDIILNPNWWPGMFYINLLFKAAITFIQFFGIFYFVKDLFAIGTGTRG
jgi:hypothetical protein